MSFPQMVLVGAALSTALAYDVAAALVGVGRSLARRVLPGGD